ncbi:MAG: hypothetical protein DSM106950_13675 [Stigonema ocellatum SAG 48.90 = DSM 106950]|nr:hypothetical protein [Stigonema ocellatum SAG 48.90 = DSM 106950]
MAQSVKTYTDQIDFWHWGELFALSSLIEEARHYCKELIVAGKKRNDCNKALQSKFNLNKRYCASIYIEVKAIVDNAKENRNHHIETLSGQIKSLKSDIKKREKQINYFAQSENKQKYKGNDKGFVPSKLKIKIACNIHAAQRKTTELQDAKFAVHQKKRKLNFLENQLKHIRLAPINYVLSPTNSLTLVGSKSESAGNQSAQFDYIESIDKFVLNIRTPYALEERLGGEYIRIDGLNFKYGKHEIIEAISERCYKVATSNGEPKWDKGYSAVTLRFYWKNGSWYVACTLDINLPEITSEYLSGYIGIDLNADSLGWAVCDAQGNLLEFGDYKLDLHSKTSNQREAILSDAATFIALKAKHYNFPIASEKLDFSEKKKQLKQKGKKYARMLSSFAYSQWNEVLDNASQKHGIYHKKVNPAYSSLIGLTKFMSMYGMNSASSAAFVIARRGRRFSERLPQHKLLPSKSAKAEDTKVKHVWSHWSKVSKSTLGIPRHKYFSARLNRTRKVKSFCQLACFLGESRRIDNPIQLELFEVGAIPTGKDAVSAAVSRSRKPRQRTENTFTQLCLDLN